MRFEVSLLAWIVSFGTASTVGAIYGGAPVPAGKWDAAVSFQWSAAGESGGCSGVLIAENVVLTAAHCVRAPSGRQRRVRSVRVGNPRGRTVRARVAGAHVHPRYDPRKPEAGADVAILVLKDAIKGRAPIRVARPDEDPKQGEKVTIAGFGVTRDGRGRIVRSRVLREIEQESLSPFHCFSGPVREMARTRMCAAHPGRAVCPGDSGSPATLRRPGQPEILVGIVSVAIDQKVCSRTATQMTRVSAFGDWIEKTTR